METWRTILGFPMYEVSNLGRVRSWSGSHPHRRTCPRILKPGRSGYRRMYLTVSLCGPDARAPKYVHRLVLEAFVGPCPEGMQCRHLDNNPANNRVENLAWGTPLENGADRVLAGTTARGDKHWSRLRPERRCRGDRHGRRKLSAPDVETVRAWLSSGVKRSEAARRMGVSYSAIRNIENGTTWADANALKAGRLSA